jgi:hypothetical protein
MPTSGTTLFSPSVADLVVECYSRIQIRGPALTPEHIIEARRSANIVFSDWSGSRSGPPLWAVDKISIPLLPGVVSYVLPPDTVLLLDVYRRQVTPAYPVAITLTGNTSDTELTSAAGLTLNVDHTGGDLGATLTPMLMGSGTPVLTNNYVPTILGAGSGTLSCVAGSTVITLVWPNHGLSPGDPIFFADQVSIGAIVLPPFVGVATVIDANTVTFLSTVPAIVTQEAQGATPLLQITAGSTDVTVTLPNHGLAAGDTFSVPISTLVGDITLYGDYTITAVANPGQFVITADTTPALSTATFSNSGLIRVGAQDSSSPITDIIMTPVSRTDYASYPDKLSTGTPTVFWLDRTIVPTVTVWQAPPSQSGLYYQMVAYRWRQLQDADPISGQSPDLPVRWIGAFTAELTARLAEKFRPEVLKEKVAIAQAAWAAAEQGDFENVPMFITPGLSGYFR